MTPAAKHALLRYGPAVLMTALVPALSLLPARFFSAAHTPLPAFPGFDKLAHALLYLALTAAYLQALPPEPQRSPAAVLRTALAASLYGLLMELCQKSFTRSRSLDPLDALANALGAFGCALLCLALARRRKPAQPPGEVSHAG